MIVSLHIATGAAGGALVRSPVAAAALGPVLHFFGDRMPHEDIDSRRFELQCGVVGLLALVVVRGPFDAATVGALTAAAPDLEHILPLPRPGGRKLFPSHRIPGWHRPGGISANAQLLIAGALFGAVLAPGLKRRLSAGA
jgi:hypothetical protein